MRYVSRFSWLVLMIWFMGSVAEAQRSMAAEELDLGTEAYRHARYDDAIEHFQRAVSLDPTKWVAHLYLATAYAQEYIPGADGAANLTRGERAIQEYKKVLELDSSRLDAVKGIAYLYLQMKKFEDATQYYRQGIAIDPKDPEMYYSIGVIDWTQSYQRRMEMRKKLNVKPEGSLINTTGCWEIRTANEDLVKNGIEMLVEALKLRPEYDDAMAYMNLLYRERADIECGNRKTYMSDLHAADKWVDLTIATKKVKSAASDRKVNPKPQ